MLVLQVGFWIFVVTHVKGKSPIALAQEDMI
eukprot:COSAG05_NODE_22264_length_266_cov_0.604790_1_plen_30_part_01